MNFRDEIAVAKVRKLNNLHSSYAKLYVHVFMYLATTNFVHAVYSLHIGSVMSLHIQKLESRSTNLNF